MQSATNVAGMLRNRIKMDTIEAIIEEFEIEKLMRGNGIARFHKNVDKAVEKSQESKTEYGMLLHTRPSWKS